MAKKVKKVVRKTISAWALQHWGSRANMCSEGRVAFDFVVRAEKKGLTPTQILRVAQREYPMFIEFIRSFEADNALEYAKDEAIDQLKRFDFDVSTESEIQLSATFKKAIKAEIERVRAFTDNRLELVLNELKNTITIR